MRVVFLSTGYFHETKSGGAVCASRNYAMLRKLCGDDNLYFFTITESEIPVSRNVFRYPRASSNLRVYKECIFGRDGYSGRTKEQVIRDILAIHPDVVFCDNTRLGDILRRLPGEIKICLFMVNVEKEYMWDRVKHSGPICLIRYFEVYKNERLALTRADYVMCLNERDARKTKEIYGRDADLLLPIHFPDGFQAEEMSKQKERSGQILFVGSSFLPNIHGITWFIENVLPEIDVELVLVGKDLEKHKERFDSPKVDVIGTVEETSPYYYAADAVVMPIFMGSGMKVKTAEALMYGKILFATDEALEGYQDAPDIYRCNTKDEFIEALNRFITDKVRSKFSPKNRRYFLESFETGQIEERFFAALRGLAAQKK